MTVQKLMSITRKAIDDFDMIPEGASVAVGVSGGKDSLALVTALAHLSKFHPSRFRVKAVTVDLGFPEADYSPIARYLETLDVEYRVVKTEIGKIIFDVRKEKNPCALCAKMKRGILCDTAKEMGCDLLALAHHKDDLIDTFLLNLFYAGRIDTFLPVTELTKTGITVIRPFLYAQEKELVYFANKNPMPVCPSGCPADKHTSREDVKGLVKTLARENPDIKAKIFGAILRSGLLERKENDTITL
ncbi:MAG: tRNA 2-thiocytidine(32) synthetase TtcA [Ruminococcaceae bacterium]|nr:tRNA 2-thiocytidine(32) synthetase TtcA [Oscillospiraceae bacterium]